MNARLRWLPLLLMLPMILLPGPGAGLVVCVDRGPDAHFAVEWAACCESPSSPSPPSTSARSACSACADIPLSGFGTRIPVRPQSADAPALLPAEGLAVYVPGPSARAAARATDPPSRAASVIPLALRI